MPIRVVLAEDSLIAREGITALLDAADDVEVVATAAEFDGLLAAVAATAPDVVVTDIRMPPSYRDEGIRAADQLRETDPELGVVVLSQHDEPEYAMALFDGGTARRAYLLKERVAEAEELVNAVRAVAAGGSVVDPKVVEGLVAQRKQGTESRLSSLTDRENEVLAQMAQGKGNDAIAAALVLTVKTVEAHIGSIFAKLGLSEERDVNRRVKAVLLYLAAA
ncbi:MAG: response regulator [Mycobacteriales bacterium]|nr:response regulator transcription factor [Frankia sp.]